MTFPKQKLKKQPVFFKGGNKKWGYLPRGARGICLSFFSISLPWPGGGFLRKTTALSTASAVSARGQTEEEASLNVREWIREADYASEVRAEQSERKEKLVRARVNLSECESACISVSPMCCICVWLYACAGLLVCVCLCLGIWMFKYVGGFCTRS